MNKKSFTATLFLQITCWILIAWVLTENLVNAGQAHAALEALQSTPQPFLGPIYYGRKDVLNVIDHNLPCASVCADDNDNVLHHNGTLYLAVTGTPNPSHTATPQGWPPPTPYIPNPGFGYDEHAGVDYLLKYVPVIAAASGDVLVADWANSSNHRDSFGLYVQLDHGTYTTLYGHLSVMIVEQGEHVTADPSDRNSIIGISGNTGALLGGCPDVGADPLCAAHLHLEVREGSGYRPVNPYGWLSTTVPDPWPTVPSHGAVSYNLWVAPPSLVSYADQYPGSNVPPVSDPGVNDARMIIDDGSADFSLSGNCWITPTPVGNDSYNNKYRAAPSNSPDSCKAFWYIREDAFTPPGEYDVYVHIPDDFTASLGAEYTIRHNNEQSVAIVVQTAYRNNNTEHDSWAYLGRYDFAMGNSSLAEYISLNDDTIADDTGNRILADAIKLAPAFEAALPQEHIYLSFSQSGTAGNVAYTDEDILSFNPDTGEWRMMFDGSDVGLTVRNVDAAEYRNGNIYFSLDNNFSTYTDVDIIRFAPTSLGSDTSGTMSLALRGSPDLSPGTEDVDAVTSSISGHVGGYLRSTIDQATVPGRIFEDEDIFSHSPYAFFLDGSLVGLSDLSEDIDGLWVDTNRDIYLSTEGNFTVSGSSGDGADIIKCTSGSGLPIACTFTPGLFWNASAHGLGSDTALVDAIFLSANDVVTDCPAFTNGGFEAQFFCWATTVNPDPANGLWRPTFIERHSGLLSAEARVEQPITHLPSYPLLTSSPIQVQPNHAYRFRFWGKTILDGPCCFMRVPAWVIWYADGLEIPVTIASLLSNPVWTEFDTGFICPPVPNVDHAQIQFMIVPHTLATNGSESLLTESGSIFIDDVTWQSQTPPPTPCPVVSQP